MTIIDILDILTLIVLLGNVILFAYQYIVLRRWRRLNQMLEAICYHAFSLRGPSLTQIIIRIEDKLETLRFDESGGLLVNRWKRIWNKK